MLFLYVSLYLHGMSSGGSCQIFLCLDWKYMKSIDPSMPSAFVGKGDGLCVYVCVCVCAHVLVCICVCVPSAFVGKGDGLYVCVCLYVDVSAVSGGAVGECGEAV